MGRPAGARTSRVLSSRLTTAPGGATRVIFTLECGHELERAIRPYSPKRAICLECGGPE